MDAVSLRMPPGKDSPVGCAACIDCDCKRTPSPMVFVLPPEPAGPPSQQLNRSSYQENRSREPWGSAHAYDLQPADHSPQPKTMLARQHLQVRQAEPGWWRRLGDDLLDMDPAQPIGHLLQRVGSAAIGPSGLGPHHFQRVQGLPPQHGQFGPIEHPVWLGRREVFQLLFPAQTGEQSRPMRQRFVRDLFSGRVRVVQRVRPRIVPNRQRLAVTAGRSVVAAKIVLDGGRERGTGVLLVQCPK